MPSVEAIDLTLTTLEENLALDEALLIDAENRGDTEFFRLWEYPRYAVVLGRNCSKDEEVWAEQCEVDGVTIARRPSGGGTVLLGPGCLNFSLVLRLDRIPPPGGVAGSFTYILSRVLDAIRVLDRRVARAGQSDLAVAGRKVSGNAQRHQRSCLLHQGCLLYGFDIPAVTRYVQEPVRQPAYRLRRHHERFLTNLPVDPRALRQQLQAAWEPLRPASAVPLDMAEHLARVKYTSDRWTNPL